MLRAATPKFIESKNFPGISASAFANFEERIKNNPAKALNYFASLQAHGSPNHKNLLLLLKKELHTPPHPNALLFWLNYLKKQDLTKKLSSISCPNFHAYGRHDKIVPKAVERKMQCIPKSKTIVFEHSSHLPFLSQCFIKWLKEAMSISS